jgi:hypothetical protein
MRTISGVRPVGQGAIRFEGVDITNMASHDRVKLGICQAPEGRGIFPGMTVRENLRMGGYILSDDKELERRIDDIFDRFPILRERAGQHAGTMSGGQQQTLSMARTLILRPEIVMLDEPSLGLAPKMVDELLAAAVTFREGGQRSALRDPRLFPAITRRHTNHQIYEDSHLDDDLLERSEACCVEDGIDLLLTADLETKHRVDDLVVRGDAIKSLTRMCGQVLDINEERILLKKSRSVS